MGTGSSTSNRCQQHTAMQTGSAMHQTDGAPAVEFSCTETATLRVGAWRNRSLSSAESALVKASAEAIGIQSVIRDLGQSWNTVVYSDTSAAPGGDTTRRHMDCRA